MLSYLSDKEEPLVLRVTGSPFEMGYAHGSALKEKIHQNITVRKSKSLIQMNDLSENITLRSHQKHFRRENINESLEKPTKEEIIKNGLKPSSKQDMNKQILRDLSNTQSPLRILLFY